MNNFNFYRPTALRPWGQGRHKYKHTDTCTKEHLAP